ncbi:MAG: hypothetical protein KH297_04570 [Firmicutes bacterium]|nr:hypothetical protein [Bacillota bacterium]
MAKVKWDYNMRNKLQLLLEEGFTLRRIADSFGVSYPNLKKEVLRGLSDEEYREKRYIKYSLEEAIMEEFKSTFDEESREIIYRARGKKNE